MLFVGAYFHDDHRRLRYDGDIREADGRTHGLTATTEPFEVGELVGLQQISGESE